jgi:hypothetical protein
MKFFVNVALVALLATPALAQYGGGPPGGGGGTGWKIDIIPVGETRILSQDTSGNGVEGVNPWSYLINNPYLGPIVYPGMTSFSTLTTMAGTHTASTNGVFKVKLTWQGTPASRPAKVYIMEAAYASYSGRNGDNSPGSGSAFNGFTSLIPFPMGGASSGKRLRQFAVGGNVVEFSSPSLSAAISIWIAPGQTGSFSVAANYSAALDDRGVSISNPIFEDGGNWKKGPNFTRVANVRNPDGSMTVDSSVPWGWKASGGSGGATGFFGWTIDTIYNANIIGFLTGLFAPTQVDWSSSGEGELWNDQQLSVNQYNVVRGEFVVANPWPKSKNTTIKVKVTDLRPDMYATAENSYTVQWHAPYEDWQAMGPARSAQRLVAARITTTQLLWNGTVNFEWFDENVNIVAYTIWESISIAMGGSGDTITSFVPSGWGAVPGSLSSLIGYLGIFIQDLNSGLNQSNISMESLFLTPESLPKDGSRTPSAYASRMFTLNSVDVLIPYLLTPYRGDGWGINGYQGAMYYTLARKRSTPYPTARGIFTIIGPNQ